MTATTIQDASAVLALLQEEPGAAEVESLLDGALMSCVNLSEVLQKAEQHGVSTEGLEYDLEALGIEFRTSTFRWRGPRRRRGHRAPACRSETARAWR